MKHILLVNPWIYDFAAFDLWIKPWGLLKLSSILKKHGFRVSFIDALDDSSEDPMKRKRQKNGTGKFFFERVKKPGVLNKIPRTYKRYGIRLEAFLDRLPPETPDYIFVSSGMTYWYPGVFKAIEILKERYKGVPLILGGIYATLSYEHAKKNSGADKIIRNNELNRISGIIGEECDFSFDNILDEQIDYEFYEKPGYGVLRTSMGCPFDCSYCAQKKLSPRLILKNIDNAVSEFRYLYGKGIRNFAFYDDALLFDQKYIAGYFKQIKVFSNKASFFTPNGLHAKYLSPEIAYLMKDVGLKNPILSLEIADDTKAGKFHSKVSKQDLITAVKNLKEAGYQKGSYTVYLMLGIPGVEESTVSESIDFVHSLGGRISLSEFTPVSGTVLAEKFPNAIKEPLLQNNSVFPAYSLEEWDEVNRLKRKAVELNHKLAASN